MVVGARPTDALIPVRELADIMDMTVPEITGRLKLLGWKNCNGNSKVPPIMTDVLINFIEGSLTPPEDDEFGPIDDPGLAPALDHPFYVLGDGTQKDFVLV